MPKQITTYGNIKGGRLHIVGRAAFDSAVDNWNDCEIELVVSRLYPKRSSRANAYYHAVVVPIARSCFEEAFGERISHLETHELLKRQVSYREIITPSGAILRITRDTKDMNTAEFLEFTTHCRQFLFEQFGADITDPVAISTTSTALPV